MAYESKPGDISVFKNDRKTADNPNWPDYQIVGLSLDGEKLKGALWLKKDRNGKTYMSGRIELDTYVKQGEDKFPSGSKGNVAGSDFDDPFGTPF